jgi:predicted TIM-barrel fold metal-dependent hydrolase
MIDGIRVIDFHAHAMTENKYGMRGDPGLMVRTMDAVGVDQACLNALIDPGGTKSNDRVAEYVARYPDRFFGFAFVSPTMPQRIRPELTRAIDELGFVAIKVYSPTTPWPLDAPQWDPIYRFADERGLAMLFHTGPHPHAQPKLLSEVAPRFPRAKFVAGHTGNTPDERAQAIAAAQANTNVYLETCSTFRTPGVIEQLVNEAGADRVLFGTDMPLMDPRPQLGKILTARISDDAKRKILGDNARRLLSI